MKRLQQARELIKNKNYKEAEKLLLELKDELIDSKHLLADLYFLTEEKEKEVAVVIELANEGDKEYQNILANWYLVGENVEVDYEKAFLYMQKSAIQNEAYATVQLAEFYKEGIGTEINFEESRKWYIKAKELALLEPFEEEKKFLLNVIENGLNELNNN